MQVVRPVGVIFLMKWERLFSLSKNLYPSRTIKGTRDLWKKVQQKINRHGGTNTGWPYQCSGRFIYVVIRSTITNGLIRHVNAFAFDMQFRTTRTPRLTAFANAQKNYMSISIILEYYIRRKRFFFYPTQSPRVTANASVLKYKKLRLKTGTNKVDRIK